MDSNILPIVMTLVGLLSLSSVITWRLGRRKMNQQSRETIVNLRERVNSWWVMLGVFLLVLWAGPLASVVMFAGVSFFALREYLTLLPTRQADHKSLFWAFFVILPAHYVLVAIEWYGLSSIFIPVYAFVFLPFRRVLAGETDDFLASVARLQWGLLVCVYFISHLPMIYQIPVVGLKGENGILLLFLVICAQASDVLQYVWGKSLGKRKIAPKVSPHKTVAGTVGGIGTTVLLGTAMSGLTPFDVWEAGIIALIVCLAGFFGGLVMSAIKRDLGAKDWGNSIPGHGGFMDRVDSLCFAAPLYFHIINFFFSEGIGNRPSPEVWERLPWLGGF